MGEWLFFRTHTAKPVQGSANAHDPPMPPCPIKQCGLLSSCLALYSSSAAAVAVADGMVEVAAAELAVVVVAARRGSIHGENPTLRCPGEAGSAAVLTVFSLSPSLHRIQWRTFSSMTRILSTTPPFAIAPYILPRERAVQKPLEDGRHND